jgi:MSHA pilin protein MshD
VQGFHRQLGVTFIELIISIVVIGIGVTGILQVMTLNTGSSADPMIRHQAIAIAEAYLDEILAKAFDDPSGGETGGAEEASRVDYDDVQDYNDLPDTVVRNQNNVAITGLNNYTVTVSITSEALGPGGAQVDAVNSRRVTVTVNTPDNNDVTVSGYRTNY